MASQSSSESSGSGSYESSDASEEEEVVLEIVVPNNKGQGGDAESEAMHESGIIDHGIILPGEGNMTTTPLSPDSNGNSPQLFERRRSHLPHDEADTLSSVSSSVTSYSSNTSSTISTVSTGMQSSPEKEYYKQKIVDKMETIISHEVVESVGDGTTTDEEGDYTTDTEKQTESDIEAEIEAEIKGESSSYEKEVQDQGVSDNEAEAEATTEVATEEVKDPEEPTTKNEAEVEVEVKVEVEEIVDTDETSIEVEDKSQGDDEEDEGEQKRELPVEEETKSETPEDSSELKNDGEHEDKDKDKVSSPKNVKPTPESSQHSFFRKNISVAAIKEDTTDGDSLSGSLSSGKDSNKKVVTLTGSIFREPEQKKAPWWDSKSSDDGASVMSGFSRGGASAMSNSSRMSSLMRSNSWVNQNALKSTMMKKKAPNSIPRTPKDKVQWWNNKDSPGKKNAIPSRPPSGADTKNSSPVKTMSSLHGLSNQFAQKQKQMEDLQDKEREEYIAKKEQETEMVDETKDELIKIEKNEEDSISDNGIRSFSDVYAMVGKKEAIKEQEVAKEEACDGNGEEQGEEQEDKESSDKEEEEEEKRTEEKPPEPEPEPEKPLQMVNFRNKRPEIPSPSEPRSVEEIVEANTVEYRELDIEFNDPKPQLLELISAATGTSAARRSNAMGTMKVLAAQRQNAIMLPRSTGLLDVLTLVISETGTENDNDNNTARTRANDVLFLISQPKENRRLICQQPGLLPLLVSTMKERADESRTQACSIVATLAKTEENRDILLKAEDMVTTLSLVVRGLYDEFGLITENPPDETNRSKKKKKDKHDFEAVLAPARLNSCAALLHLSKQCSGAAQICQNDVFMKSLVTVCNEIENPIHTRCLEMLCNLTRLPTNNSILSSNKDVISALMKGCNSNSEDDRVWALRSMQNITSDSASKKIVATPAMLELLGASARRNDEEQEAAVASMLNLSTDSKAIVALMNTKNVVSTLLRLAHSDDSSAEIRMMSCDTLATIALRLQAIASAGTVPDGIEPAPLPTLVSTGWLRWD